jgi:hypothetical protein
LQTKASWCFGADYTGDLRKLDNIRALCTDARVSFRLFLSESSPAFFPCLSSRAHRVVLCWQVSLGWFGAHLCTADGSIDCMVSASLVLFVPC